MRRGRQTAFLVCVLAALFFMSALAGRGAKNASALPLGERISNMDEVVASIRRGLKNHARSITVTFDYGSDIFDELNGVIGDWVEEALAETSDPTEGDYIRYQYGGYTYDSSYTVQDGRFFYTVRIEPEYYCTLAQEAQVTERLAELRRDFGFRLWTSGVERIRTIYDYICQNVSYDKVHRKNPYSHLKSTAYAALIMDTATCQGYCVSLYRLLREAGIECRIVTGTATGEDGAELHAWVIAEADGLFYVLDPTWDAGSEEYRFFLVGSGSVADRVPGDKFLTEGFLERYPVSETDYAYDGA